MEVRTPRERLYVEDLMTDSVFAVRPGDTLAAVADLMADRRVRHVPVVEPTGRLVGLISQRDLLRNRLIEQTQVSRRVERAVLDGLNADELMRTELLTVAPRTDIREAARIMFEEKLGCLPVVEDGALVGILTEADFVRFLA